MGKTRGARASGHREGIPGLLSLALAVAWCAACGSARDAPPRGVPDRPHVILVVADDLDRGACGFVPGARDPFLTPTLSSLAAEGVVLTELHSPSPVCTPSRFALLTGRYASRSTASAFRRQAERDGQTAVSFDTLLEPSDDNLAKQLRRAGYATGAVGKNHVIAVPAFERLPYPSDPDDPEVRRVLAANARALEEAFHAAGFDYAASLYQANVDDAGIEALAVHNQDWITDAALRFLDAHHETPFFLYLATTIPHGPIEASRSWKADPRITPAGRLAAAPEVQAARDTIEPRIEAADVSRWNGPAVLWMDDAIAAIVARLEALGIAERTVLVFLGDHGTTCKGSVYRRGSRTVGLVWTRGGFAVGSQSPVLASLVDLAPTILDWAGDPTDAAGFDGASLAGVLRGEVSQVRDSLYLEMGYSRGIQKDGWKYIAVRHPETVRSIPLQERAEILAESNAELRQRGRPLPTTDPTAPFSHLFAIPGGHDVDQVAIRHQPSYFDRDQLFDLRADPDEQVNLAADPAHAEKLAALRAELARHVEKLGDTFGEFGAGRR